MAENLNPPPITPPNKWWDDPDLKTDVEELYYYLYQSFNSINDLNDLTEIEISTPTGDVTTTGNDFIKATVAMTITLNPSPDNREQVIVYHAAGNSVNVSVTDGVGTDILNTDQMVVSYRYYSDLTEWVRGS